jgi:hypothetical protein
MKTQKSVTGRWSAQATGQRRPPVQHETNVTRAYRLGKSETLWDFICLLTDGRYTVEALRNEIVRRMHDLIMLDPCEIPEPEQEQKIQEYQGQADACYALEELLDDQGLRGADLDSALAERLFAAWPPAYLEYRRRYMAFEEQDPTMPDKVDCLELRNWYKTVDSLAYVVDRDRRAGQPRSEDQRILQLQLLRVPGEHTPHAE